MRTRVPQIPSARSRKPKRTRSGSTDGYDATSWGLATEYTAAEVGTKDGYNEVAWDASAQLMWAGSLTQDNTILFRTVVEAP